MKKVFKAGSRVVITGCAGFIGSHLVRKFLNEGHTVLGVDDLSVGFPSNMADFIAHKSFVFCNLDIRSYKEIAKSIETVFGDTIDILYHLAARGETYWCQENPNQAVDVNINGTLSILKIAENFRCVHFVFADTSAEYDNIPFRKEIIKDNYPESRSYDIYPATYPSKENQAPTTSTPFGIYSITKMCASQFVRSKTSDKTFGSTLVRPFNVYGPSMNLDRDIPPVIGAFIKDNLYNLPHKIFGNGEKRRDFIFIDDSVEMLYLIFKKRFGQFDTQTFNMGTGKNYSINEVYKLVGKEMNVVCYPQYLPNKSYEAEVTLADMSKTEKFFDWKPKVDIEEGIHLTVKGILKK